MKWIFFNNDGAALGDGGFGKVFPCHQVGADDVLVDAELAVKLFIEKPDEDNDEMRRRFRNGGRLGRRLRHPNILSVVGTGDLDDRTPYIVMRLADGGTLQQWLGASDRAEADLVVVFRQVLEAIAYAHGQNILHRDIKPLNILFVNGVPQVADFDLAKDIDPQSDATAITATNVGIGSRGYMAPEQFDDLKRVGPPADVYALGRVWWRMLSGREPGDGLLDLSAVPAQWRALIDKACEYRKHQRYGSAGEMLRAFDSLVAAPPGSPMQTAQELAERWNEDEPDKHWKTLRQLDEHFHRHADDEALHSELAPFLPTALLDQWMEDHPGGFRQMVAGVDDASSGSLLWDDCDGFARFYIRIFESSTDEELRCRAIEQVLRIGAKHNRYPVANMFRALLSRVGGDNESAALIARAARNEPLYAVWFHIPADCHPAVVAAFAAPSTDD